MVFAGEDTFRGGGNGRHTKEVPLFVAVGLELSVVGAVRKESGQR